VSSCPVGAAPERCRVVQYLDPRRGADAASQAPPVRLGVQVGNALPRKFTGQAGKHGVSLTEALTSSRTRIR
jgi:hypothetical protein